MKVIDPKDASLEKDIERALRFAALFATDVVWHANGKFAALARGERKLEEHEAHGIRHACAHQGGQA